MLDPMADCSGRRPGYWRCPTCIWKKVLLRLAKEFDSAVGHACDPGSADAFVTPLEASHRRDVGDSFHDPEAPGGCRKANVTG